MNTKPMLQAVLDELQTRKGQWREIARQMDPETPESYYSWLTKLAQGTIPDPSVNRVQRLFDFLRIGANDAVVEKLVAGDTEGLVKKIKAMQRNFGELPDGSPDPDKNRGIGDTPPAPIKEAA